MNQKKNIQKYTQFILFLIVIILLNVVGINLFKGINIDLTSNQRYTLSKSSKEIAEKLQDPLRVHIFYSGNLPAQYNQIIVSLRDLLPEYAEGSKYFQYEFLDCTIDKEKDSEKISNNLKKAAGFGIHDVTVQTLDKGELKVVRVFKGIAIQHGDLIEKINSLEVNDLQQLEYKLTSLMKNMLNKISLLQRLEEDIKVELITDMRLFNVLQSDHKINSFISIIEAGVNDANKQLYNRLKLSLLTNYKEKNYLESIAKNKLREISWNTTKSSEGKTIQAGKSACAIVIQYKNKKEIIELLTTKYALTSRGLVPQYGIKKSEKWDELFVNTVNNLLDVNQNILYLSDKGTLPTISSTPQGIPGFRQQQQADGANFKEFLSQDYTFVETSLNDLADQGETLIIAGASEKLSDYELFKIDQFLMKGRSIVFFQDGMKEVPSPQNNPFQPTPPSYQINDTGLEKLLEHYGVKVENRFAYDNGSAYKVPQQQNQAGQIQPSYLLKAFPKVTRKYINNDVDIFNNINEFLCFLVSPLQLVSNDLQANVSSRLLFSTTKNGFTENNASLASYLQPNPSPNDLKTIPLAYELSGEFISYFVDKEIPRPNEEDIEEDNKATNSSFNNKLNTQNSLIKKSKANSRIIVMGSSKGLVNQYLPFAAFPSALVQLALVDYGAQNGSLSLLRSKNNSVRLIYGEEEANLVAKFFLKNKVIFEKFKCFWSSLIDGSFRINDLFI